MRGPCGAGPRLVRHTMARSNAVVFFIDGRSPPAARMRAIANLAAGRSPAAADGAPKGIRRPVGWRLVRVSPRWREHARLGVGDRTARLMAARMRARPRALIECHNHNVNLRSPFTFRNVRSPGYVGYDANAFARQTGPIVGDAVARPESRPPLLA